MWRTQEEKEQWADDHGYVGYRCPKCRHHFRDDCGGHECPFCDVTDKETAGEQGE